MRRTPYGPRTSAVIADEEAVADKHVHVPPDESKARAKGSQRGQRAGTPVAHSAWPVDPSVTGGSAARRGGHTQCPLRRLNQVGALTALLADEEFAALVRDEGSGRVAWWQWPVGHPLRRRSPLLQTHAWLSWPAR